MLGSSPSSCTCSAWAAWKRTSSTRFPRASRIVLPLRHLGRLVFARRKQRTRTAMKSPAASTGHVEPPSVLPNLSTHRYLPTVSTPLPSRPPYCHLDSQASRELLSAVALCADHLSTQITLAHRTVQSGFDAVSRNATTKAIRKLCNDLCDPKSGLSLEIITRGHPVIFMAQQPPSSLHDQAIIQHFVVSSLRHSQQSQPKADDAPADWWGDLTISTGKLLRIG